TSGGPYANVSGTLAANTTSFTDTPPAFTRYYYVVHSTKAGTPDSVSNEANGTNVQCIANLTSSTKVISQVNGSAYSNSTVIKTGDIVTFQITLRNVGNTKANVTHLCDEPTSNFTIANS